MSDKKRSAVGEERGGGSSFSLLLHSSNYRTFCFLVHTYENLGNTRFI